MADGFNSPCRARPPEIPAVLSLFSNIRGKGCFDFQRPKG